MYENNNGVNSQVEVRKIGERDKIVAIFSLARLWISNQVFTSLQAKQVLILEKNNSSGLGPESALSIAEIEIG